MPQFEQETIDRMRDHKFVVAFHGEASSAEVIHGWDAMIDHIKHQMDDEGDFELPEEFFNPDQWHTDGWDLPFNLHRCELADMVNLTVFRLSQPPNQTSPAQPFEVRYGASKMTVDVSGGASKFFDDEGGPLFTLPMEFPPVACEHVARVFQKGQDWGRIDGRTEIQSKFRQLMEI